MASRVCVEKGNYDVANPPRDRVPTMQQASIERDHPALAGALRCAGVCKKRSATVVFGPVVNLLKNVRTQNQKQAARPPSCADDTNKGAARTGRSSRSSAKTETGRSAVAASAAAAPSLRTACISPKGGTKQPPAPRGSGRERQRENADRRVCAHLTRKASMTRIELGGSPNCRPSIGNINSRPEQPESCA